MDQKPHNPLTSARNAGVAVHDDNADLLPCPFCGGEAKLFTEKLQLCPIWWVECSQRPTPHHSNGTRSEQAARDEWNARATTPQPSATCAENAQGDEVARQKPEDYSPQPTKHLETWMREAAVAHGDSYPLFTKRFIEVADYMANADAKNAELHNLWVFWRNEADEHSRERHKAIRRAEQAEARERALLDNNEAERQTLRRINAEIAALKAEVQRLREALQAELTFAEGVAAEIEIEAEETSFTVRVMPGGCEIATRTWADVHAASRTALRAHEQKGGV